MSLSDHINISPHKVSAIIIEQLLIVQTSQDILLITVRLSDPAAVTQNV